MPVDCPPSGAVGPVQFFLDQGTQLPQLRLPDLKDGLNVLPATRSVAARDWIALEPLADGRDQWWRLPGHGVHPAAAPWSSRRTAAGGDVVGEYRAGRRGGGANRRSLRRFPSHTALAFEREPPRRTTIHGPYRRRSTR